MFSAGTAAAACVGGWAGNAAADDDRRHAGTNLANPRTSVWFMKSLRRDALPGWAKLNRCWN
eukprot:scaffold27813_cov13-Tisochrysis_lutea.AAC.1